MNLVFKRHVSQGPFVLSDGAVVSSVGDPLEPCAYSRDIEWILFSNPNLSRTPSVDFLVFLVGQRIVHVLSVNSSLSRHGRALMIDVVGYRNDVLTIFCGVIMCGLFGLAVALFMLG